MLIHDDCQFHHVQELEPHPNGGLQLQRFPRHTCDRLDAPRGRFISQQCVGCEVRMVCTGPSVAPTFGAPEQDVTLVVFRGEVELAEYQIPVGTIRTIRCDTPPSFNYMDPDALSGAFHPDVWRFQVYGVTTWHGVASYGHQLRPPTAEELPRRRYLAHGSSITHGSPTTYAMQTARRLGADIWNYGMSGACMCEAPMAEYLGSLEQDFDVITCELGINMRASYTPEQFIERAGRLLDSIAAGHPRTPLGVITVFPNSENHRISGDKTLGQTQAAYDAFLRQWVADNQNRAAPTELIEGRDILTSITGHRGDMVHPTIWGSIEMGERLAARLEALLE